MHSEPEKERERWRIKNMPIHNYSPVLIIMMKKVKGFSGVKGARKI